MTVGQDLHRQAAREDFRQARRQASLQQVLGGLRRERAELLPFDEMRQDLKATGTDDLGLQEIPLDAIVGSVSRHEDYTRTFLPKRDGDEERWVNVKRQIDQAGIRPITVYKLGEAYFVNDGNHRVSIARQMGSKTIQAYVTEVKPRVPLTPDDSPDSIICKTRYAEFLELTNLDKLRPQADLLMTIPGQYRTLQEQIEAQHFLLELNPSRDKVPYEEAVTAWYDRSYMPIVRLLRKQGLQHDFPELTEADLYVMVLKHRSQLREDLNWNVDFVAVTSDLSRHKSRLRQRIMNRFSHRLRNTFLPDALESGPATGSWREDRLDRRPGSYLFADILVAGRGVAADYGMVQQAAIIAQQEQSRLLALRVTKNEAERSSPEVRKIQADFEAFCQERGIRGEFATEIGRPARIIVQRAAWIDLLVLSLVHHSGPRTTTGFGTDFNKILQRSPRPILIVPEGAYSPLNRALLAYDGSPKSDEALYLSAYVTATWGGSLVVVSVRDEVAKVAQRRARSYLAMRDIEAEYVTAKPPIGSAILNAARANQCDWIIMGGYGDRPLLQLLVGSTVTKVLRKTDLPVLVCR